MGAVGNGWFPYVILGIVAKGNYIRAKRIFTALVCPITAKHTWLHRLGKHDALDAGLQFSLGGLKNGIVNSGWSF